MDKQKAQNKPYAVLVEIDGIDDACRRKIIDAVHTREIKTNHQVEIKWIVEEKVVSPFLCFSIKSNQNKRQQIDLTNDMMTQVEKQLKSENVLSSDSYFFYVITKFTAMSQIDRIGSIEE